MEQPPCQIVFISMRLLHFEEYPRELPISRRRRLTWNVEKCPAAR
jgi:hypothetical protein